MKEHRMTEEETEGPTSSWGTGNTPNPSGTWWWWWWWSGVLPYTYTYSIYIYTHTYTHKIKLKIIFVRWNWEKAVQNFRNKKLHNMYSSPYITQPVKLRERWENVVCMGDETCTQNFSQMKGQDKDVKQHMDHKAGLNYSSKTQVWLCRIS